MKTYECSICYTINVAVKLHCSTCGTIPAKYSILRAPSRLIDHEFWSQFIPVAPAIGCSRGLQKFSYKSKLHSVPLDYYAEGE